MRRLEQTLPTPAENLALDEALLDWAEEENRDWEFLRVWESPQPIVVVGRSSRVEQEVNTAACRKQGIPILRRSSGGAAIVAGPGCLMYAVVLSYALRPELNDIGRAHSFVLSRLTAGLQSVLTPPAIVQHAGTSDLILWHSGNPSAALKFSGNSLRAKRTHLLYHGTLLYDSDLSLIESCLRMPPRVPEYRGGRGHGDFVTNLPISRSALLAAIDAAWPATETLHEWPVQRTRELAAERFSRDSWTYEFV